eukprot:COSAG02_NODE_440_length_22296_cov_173.657386_11_plen_87_part_00
MSQIHGGIDMVLWRKRDARQHFELLPQFAYDFVELHPGACLFAALAAPGQRLVAAADPYQERGLAANSPGDMATHPITTRRPWKAT